MISVIVPIYNVEKFLPKCLNSLIAQSCEDIEIILVDDGSTDACPKLCDTCAAKDSRIKVIHKENGGLISARQAGLRAAAGEYIGFVDGDDWIEPNMYEVFYKQIELHHPDMLVCEFFYSYPDKEEKSQYRLKQSLYTRAELEKNVFPTMLFYEKFYQFGVYPNCWSKVFKKELLEKYLFQVDTRTRLGEDTAFTYPCLMDSNSLCFIEEPLYHYRINNESMTKKYDSQLPEIFILPYRALVNSNCAIGVDLTSQLPYYLLYLVNFVIRNEASERNPKSKKERIAVLESLLNNKDVMENIKKVEMGILPFHTKLLVQCFKWKSRFLLALYIKLLRNFL